MYILLLLTIFPLNCMALYCFDSNSKGAGTVVNCSEKEICYSEFYSISADAKSKNPAEWYVDRFCVHKEQCLRRGIGAGRCVDLSKLDRVVQETFRVKINQKHTINTEKRLLHSEFCCCSESLCNKLNLEELKSRFNLSLVNSTVRNEYGVVKTVLILFAVLKLVLIE